MSDEKYYGGDRGVLSAGTCSVSFAPIKHLQEITNEVPFYVPDERINVSQVIERDLQYLLQELSETSDEKVILYLHGYNVDFPKSCRRAALFKRSVGLNGRFLLFSWPADGNVLKYSWDESDLNWSVYYLAEFLDSIITVKGAGNVDIVAHSLGARGAVQALSRLACDHVHAPLIDELILLAPDIDTEIFVQELDRIKPAVKRITIYVSDNDRALKLSNEVHGYARLGQSGENLTPMKGIDTIDISNMRSRRISGHLYHLYNDQVAEDLKILLNSGQPPGKRPALEIRHKDGRVYWLMVPQEQ